MHHALLGNVQFFHVATFERLLVLHSFQSLKEKVVTGVLHMISSSDNFHVLIIRI